MSMDLFVLLLIHCTGTWMSSSFNVLLQLMDVYFDCESRNECCEKFGNKSAHLLHVLSLYIFKAMHYYFTIIEISSLFNKTNIKRKITVILFFFWMSCSKM